MLTVVDGDSAFEERLENPLFLLLYTVALVGTVVFPVIGAWLAAGWARDRVLDNRGFVPAVVLVVGYVVAGTVTEVVLDASQPWTALPEHLAVVGALYGLTAIGVGSILGWALRAALRQLRSVGTMTSRAMPLLLLVTTFGFYSAEIWQSAGQISRGQIVLILGFFAVLSGLFLCSVFAAEVRALRTGHASDDHFSALPDDPFAGLSAEVTATSEPLTPLERANVILILLLTMMLQALVFAMVVFVAFAVLGKLSAPDAAIRTWMGRSPTPGQLLGLQVPLSNELVHVCLFIAAFSTLYFIATIVTDSAHRKTFFDPVVDHLEVSLAGRAVYLARFGRRSATRRADRQPQP